MAIQILLHQDRPKILPHRMSWSNKYTFASIITMSGICLAWWRLSVFPQQLVRSHSTLSCWYTVTWSCNPEVERNGCKQKAQCVPHRLASFHSNSRNQAEPPSAWNRQSVTAWGRYIYNDHVRFTAASYLHQGICPLVIFSESVQNN